MSVFLDKSETIKTRLEALPELVDAAVLVDRQKDFKAEFDLAMMQITGSAVVISWEGGVVKNQANAVTSNYTISVWMKPILQQNATPADDQVQAVIKALHRWHDEELLCMNAMNVGEIALVPDDNFLIYSVKASVLLHL